MDRMSVAAATAMAISGLARSFPIPAPCCCGTAATPRTSPRALGQRPNRAVLRARSIPPARLSALPVGGRPAGVHAARAACVGLAVAVARADAGREIDRLLQEVASLHQQITLAQVDSLEDAAVQLRRLAHYVEGSAPAVVGQFENRRD